MTKKQLTQTTLVGTNTCGSTNFKGFKKGKPKTKPAILRYILTNKSIINIIVVLLISVILQQETSEEISRVITN